MGLLNYLQLEINMSIAERELTPAEKKQLKKYEKEISKKDFTKRYGKKEGTKIYYATLTKMAKEKVEEMYSSVPVMVM